MEVPIHKLQPALISAANEKIEAFRPVRPVRPGRVQPLLAARTATLQAGAAGMASERASEQAGY